MQENPMQNAMQPFVKLVQSNMELLTKFSASPEGMSQTAAGMQNLFKPGQMPSAELLNSNAFAQLAQGMVKNYTEFMTELGQAGMAMVTQGQSALTRQVQDASSGMVQQVKANGQ